MRPSKIMQVNCYSKDLTGSLPSSSKTFDHSSIIQYVYPMNAVSQCSVEIERGRECKYQLLYCGLWMI